MTRVAVDVGGTFTDFVIFDEAEGKLYTQKFPTSTSDPSEAVVVAVSSWVSQHVDLEEVETFLHGTTITTNALIEHRGAKIGLILSRGFKGIYQVKEHIKPGPGWSMTTAPQEPLFDETCVFELTGRIAKDGEVITAIDEADLRELAQRIAERELDSVAICLLHSYANSSHELAAKRVISEVALRTRVVCSSEVQPRIREWARTSTTLLDVYLEPVLTGYIERLGKGIDAAGLASPQAYLMGSNGGVLAFSSVVSGGKAVHSLLSGPAAAVQAARQLSEATGYRNLVSVDLGGTSCDIAFIDDGKVLEVTDTTIAGYQIQVPSIEIITIGAGGGTIARVDVDGRLWIGPESAGAVPGPASYGRGGTAATITDADLVLGYLNPDYFLGGSLNLDLGRAEQVVQQQIGHHLGLSVVEAAEAMVHTNEIHMADAIHVLAAKRGINLADFVLLACGGAGPVHAVALAEELGIETVIVPETPGVFAATGLLCTDLFQDYVQTAIARLESMQSEVIAAHFEELQQRAISEFALQGIGAAEIKFEHEIDARYAGQGFELRIPVSSPVMPALNGHLSQLFHETHQKIYGHKALTEPIEVVSYRLRARVPIAQQYPWNEVTKKESGRHRSSRRVHFPSGWYDAEVIRRDELGRDDLFEGPVVLEQPDTTTVVPPGWTCAVGSAASLVITSAR